MEIRINEALALANSKGLKILKKDLAAALFPGASEDSQRVSFCRMTSGKTKRISIDEIEIICNICKVSPNFLFGYDG